ncbi:hypothetical protein FG91_03824 [Sphingopyxis sp. LC81]|uniref:hypothetical protein n=1 Tax=Sphingopyxis sp. LC81 TaxID=1502850 RepID=UPI00050F6C61|nr:hypothetical protein [Sphingopyxis sp. LC81]KGB51916.1 hypothetical protein FG91_03824 [Sphingopyxis sp. LC81]
MTALATSRKQPPAIAPRGLLQDIAFSFVSVSCWLAINCLAAAGVMLGFFALMANLSVDQFFAETANLSNHYLAADGARRSEFAEILLYLFGGLVLFFCITRRAALLANASTPKGDMSND